MTDQRVLILGGTTEARITAQALAAQGAPVTFSLAGLTRCPRLPQGVQLRSGGFGGAAGLAAYLNRQGIDLLIDATHPFASRMSWNAFAAARASGVPHLAVQRLAWTPAPGDRWTQVGSLAKAVKRLSPLPPKAVMLALGGQGARRFRACRQHRFQARVLFDSQTPLARQAAQRWRRLEVIRIARKQTVAEEMATLQTFGADLMIVRNAGGTMDAKLDAARRLRLPVWLIERPAMPPVLTFESPRDLLCHLGHDKAQQRQADSRDSMQRHHRENTVKRNRR